MKYLTKKSLLVLAIIFSSENSLADLMAANLYQCKGRNVSVSYSASSIQGEPQLRITVGKRGYSANGEALQMQATVLGNLLSVVKIAQPDLYTDTLSVLLPNVNVANLGERVTFKSDLFVTRTKTSIAGPALVNGVIENNSATTLNCTATAVVF